MNDHNDKDLKPRRNHVVRIDVRADEELYRLIVREADKQGISLGEVLTTIAAEHFGKPELGAVEKAKPGPKPGKARATA